MQKMNRDEIYQNLLKEAKSDHGVIGFILLAGRGRGFVTEHSDYDIAIIVLDEKKTECLEKYEKFNKTEVIDVGVYSFTDFKNHAAWDTGEAWDRYNFAHLTAEIDPTGEIQKIIDEKGMIPPGRIKEFVSKKLDGYMNLYYRMLKNARDGNSTAAYLDGAESMFYLLDILFGIEGRIGPYNKFLEWELKEYPLKLLPLPPEQFIEKLKKIMTTDNVDSQKEIFGKILKLFRQGGYGKVIDGWKGYFILDDHL